MPLTRKLQQLVDDLAVLDDPQERLGLVVDRAKNRPSLPPEERVEANRVRACISVVWLVGELREGRCYFRSDAESPVVRGLVALLCEFFSGFTPAAIAASEVDPLATLGFAPHLTPTRRNGLSAARATIRAFAQKHMHPLYDAHNHLQDAWLQPHRATVFADLAALPLGRAVVNGTEEADWSEVASLAREHAFILPSYGLHPWNLGNASPAWREALRRYLAADPRAAMGEIGLDRWILEGARPDDARMAGLRRAPLDQQVEAFTWQLALAAEKNLPVSIHCLDAWGALAQALRATPRPARGFLLHAYGGSAEMAQEFALLGAYFSFNGCFLDVRHSAKQDVFKALPIDRILVETDAPAMPLPAGRRTHSLPGLAEGKPINHPANIGAVYQGLADVRGLPFAALAERVEQNFLRLFGGH